MRCKKSIRLGLLLTKASLAVTTVLGQNLVVDQASGTLEESISQASQIPDNSVAQSFTPALGAVGFVELRSLIVQPGSTTVTLVVNLREGAYNGQIVSSTTPVILLQQFTDLGTFYFPNNISVTPGQHYFFEPVLLSNGGLSIGVKAGDSYPQGDLWGNGVPSGGAGDLWFREGIVVPVPEPDLAWLAVLGCGAVLMVKRRI